MGPPGNNTATVCTARKRLFGCHDFVTSFLSRVSVRVCDLMPGRYFGEGEWA